MRVIAITPIHVTDEELARRQERYSRLAPEGVTVELRNLTKQSPVALDEQTDVLSSDAALMDDMCHVKEDTFDVILPDCVLDPGFRPGKMVRLWECSRAWLRTWLSRDIRSVR